MSIPADRLDSLIEAAGKSESEGRAWRAVDALGQLRGEARGPAAAGRPRAVRAASLIDDMSVLVARCERLLEQAAAVQAELAMVRRDMAELHGLPVDP